jgi:hypothetical protein
MKKLIFLIVLLGIAAEAIAQTPLPRKRTQWLDLSEAVKDSIRASGYVFPVPSDSVSPDTSYVSADSGLGGGGWLELGDSVGVHVNVDSVTIDILNDTLRADTLRLVTITALIDTIATLYPIPHDSLDTDTIWVSADSGLGGGGSVELGDTIGVHVNVDSVTIDILNDTLRVDTTRIATLPDVSDSSQYYYWRSVSHDHYPSYGNLVPWDLNDYQTDQDSVFICFWQEAATLKPYIEIKADSASTDSQYVHLVYSFTAPRNVSAISDTLFIVEFKTSVADTDSVGCELLVYEGTTARYATDTMTASATWTTKAITNAQGTLSDIVKEDRFQLIIRVKALNSSAAVDPTTWISRIRERWW